MHPETGAFFMDKTFDIFGQIKKELEDFRKDYILIAGTNTEETARYLSRKSKDYNFNQKEMINLIDLYYNSKFETGNIDSEGQRKLFLNICAFRADVASKMVDIDTKDFVFIPDDEGSKWGCYFIQKEFKQWARKTYFGELINDVVDVFPRYGTVVIKKVGKKLERVPLKNLVNQQDAKDLKTATHVIEIHENMTLDDMKSYPNWDTKGLEMDFGQKTTVYERYGRVPLKFFNQMKGLSTNVADDETIDVVVIGTLKPTIDGKSTTGHILFIEEVKDRPYLEVHWKRQDGRWLGIGEVENQLENQISRNMIANLRRRALLWSSKKIFQSSDDTVARNLVRDVKDGEVLRIAPNGNITQVDMASREVGEFQSTEEIWEKNSDQKSFTYEAATGESMPSGTPFRLGVIATNAVNSHFGLKKEKLGLFFKKVVVEFVYDIFKKENSRKHTLTLMGTESGINDLKKVASEIELNNKIFNWAMDDTNTVVPDFEQWKNDIENSYKEKTHLFVDIPDKFYDEINNHVELVITGEEIDIPAKIETYTTLYQSLAQTGDPRAEQVLSKIMELTGDTLEAMLGPKPQPAPQMSTPQPSQESTMPQPTPNPTMQL